jgi:peptidoglycan/xylan/chitin deacetylase (PgdA/CDA1 family)
MTRVPVMSFHSVGDAGLPYDLRHLTTSVGVLERILKWLGRNGFQTLTHQQLFDHLANGTEVPKKSLILAFDDGYLDNWVYVHPLLKKYGQRGVIYVTGEFVESGEQLRPTLENVWNGQANREQLPGLGYCNWAELRAMSEAGTLEVQSHLMTHSWQAVSDKIVGFHHPGQPWYWEAWNRDVAAKPGWLDWSREDLDQRIPWGTPVFENARTHTAPRCTPDPKIAEAVAAHVAAFASPSPSPSPTAGRGRGRGPVSEHACTFFNQPDWEQQLKDVAAKVDAAAPLLESREEFEQRFESECSEIRRLIEKHIPKQQANFMAWPGGCYDSRLQELALKHYDATFTTDQGVTAPGEDPTLIKRSFFSQRSPEVMGWDYPSYLHFVGRMQRLRGHGAYRLHTFLANRVINRAARRKDP